MGHFFPIGRLIFVTQVELFGPHYIYLVVTNFFVVVMICRQTLLVLCQSGILKKNQTFMFYPLIALYLISEGVQYDIQWGFQIAWLLSVLFALLTTQELLNPIVRVSRLIPFFILTWLSLGSNLPLMTLLISVFVLSGKKCWSIRRISVLFFLNTAAICLTFLGMEIAKRNNPTDLTAIGSQLDYLFIAKHIVEILKIAIAMTTSWLIAPLTIVVPSGVIKFEIFAQKFQNNFVLTLVIFLGLIFIAARQLKSGPNHKKMDMFPGSILIALYFSCLIVAIGRYGNFGSYFHVRYAPVFSLYSFLFWVAIFQSMQLANRGIVGVIRQGAAVIILATCLFSVFVFPWALKSASYSGRIEKTNSWERNLEQCRTSGQTEVLRDIQPVMDGIRICRIVNALELIP
jgi:hypothetical protein